MYAEFLGERGGWCAGEVAIQERRTFRIAYSGLFLTDRWDGSMGRSVAALTRENAVQTRHVVGVGIARDQAFATAPTRSTPPSMKLGADPFLPCRSGWLNTVPLSGVSP